MWRASIWVLHRPSLRMQPNGMVTISWRISGRRSKHLWRERDQRAAVFHQPDRRGVDTGLEAALGYVRLNGAQIAVVTGVNVDIDRFGAANTPVVGSNVSPDVFTAGRSPVRRLSAYITNNAYLTAFAMKPRYSCSCGSRSRATSRVTSSPLRRGAGAEAPAPMTRTRSSRKRSTFRALPAHDDTVTTTRLILSFRIQPPA